jgi:hypothetical protein
MFKMRNWFYGVLAALAAWLGYTAWAVDNTVTGTAPTANVDGSPVALASIRIYKVVLTGTAPNCATATYSVFATVPFTLAGGTFTVQDPNQTISGRYCYQATALGTNGLESARSATAFKDVDTRVPNAPTTLTVN